jgi:hypothetical protein
MTAAFRLWQELAACGVSLAVAGEDLRYAGPKHELTELRKGLIKQHKQELIRIVNTGTTFQNDDDRSITAAAVRKAGWLALDEGLAYSMQVSPTCMVFLLRDENGTWRVWRGNWRKGEPSPFSQKTLGEGLTFEEALDRGNGYVAWMRNRQ